MSEYSIHTTHTQMGVNACVTHLLGLTIKLIPKTSTNTKNVQMDASNWVPGRTDEGFWTEKPNKLAYKCAW